jgi:hypothetical protein
MVKFGSLSAANSTKLRLTMACEQNEDSGVGIQMKQQVDSSTRADLLSALLLLCCVL